VEYPDPHFKLEELFRGLSAASGGQHTQALTVGPDVGHGRRGVTATACVPDSGDLIWTDTALAQAQPVNFHRRSFLSVMASCPGRVERQPATTDGGTNPAMADGKRKRSVETALRIALRPTLWTLTVISAQPNVRRG
jgi:hypothetical protein